MFKKILNIVKKIIIGIFLLYGLDLITSAIDFMIPINVITILITSFLGIPGLCTLIALYFII